MLKRAFLPLLMLLACFTLAACHADTVHPDFLHPKVGDFAHAVRNTLVLPDGRALFYTQSLAEERNRTGETAPPIVLLDPETGAVRTYHLPLPEKRMNTHGIVLKDGTVLFTSWGAKIDRFNPNTLQFSHVGTSRIPRETPAIAELPDGNILLLGNENFLKYSEPVAHVESFDLKTRKSTLTGALNTFKLGNAFPLPNGEVLLIAVSRHLLFAKAVRSPKAEFILAPRPEDIPKAEALLRKKQAEYEASGEPPPTFFIVRNEQERREAYLQADKLQAESEQANDIVMRTPQYCSLEHFQPKTGHLRTLKKWEGSDCPQKEALVLPSGKVLLYGVWAAAVSAPQAWRQEQTQSGVSAWVLNPQSGEMENSHNTDAISSGDAVHSSLAALPTGEILYTSPTPKRGCKPDLLKAFNPFTRQTKVIGQLAAVRIRGRLLLLPEKGLLVAGGYTSPDCHPKSKPQPATTYEFFPIESLQRAIANIPPSPDGAQALQ